MFHTMLVEIVQPNVKYCFRYMELMLSEEGEMYRKSASLVFVFVLLLSAVLGARLAKEGVDVANPRDSEQRVFSGLGADGGGLTPRELQVVDLVNGTRAYNYDLGLERISFNHTLSNYAFRSGGSAGANETANWIAEQFEGLGLEVHKESFEFTTWDVLSRPVLVIDDDGDSGTTGDQNIIESFQSTHYSWPTPQDGVFADLVVLPLPAATDRGEIGMNPIDINTWNAINTTEKIVLIGKEVRWDYNWEGTYKSKMGAQTPAAVIFTWWYDWMSFYPPMFSSAGGRPISSWGHYFWDFQIAVGWVDYEDGLCIRDRESSMDVSANVTIESVIGTGMHHNVIGKLEGYSNPDKFVIVSSHYDTVMCSGFCDNGAGTAGVIELARVFSEALEKGLHYPKYTILFIPFASEELGFVGSINYVKQHKGEMANIPAVINLDGIGSDEFYVSETNPVNGFDLDEAILDAAQDLGIAAMLESPGGSDQESFRSPSLVNDLYYWWWGLEAGISDATRVEASTLLISRPLLYSDKWSMGTPGWIHTSYDNSTSTQTLSWVEADDLESQIRVAALGVMRLSRDIAITNISTSKTIVEQGYFVFINITVENQGSYTETVNVTTYYDESPIGTQTLITLTSGSSTTLTALWNITDIAKGNYTIKAHITPLPYETDTTDNTLIDGTVTVTWLGDLDGDYEVNEDDLWHFCAAFIAYWKTSVKDENCDFDADNDIDEDDLWTMCEAFIDYYKAK